TLLDARTIPQLTVRWRFRLRAKASFGAITSNPVIRGNTVYLQDSTSSVYALDARTGALRWKHTYVAPNDGPNGLTVVGSRVYAATDTTAFALDAATGRRPWSRRLANRVEQFVAIAPVVVLAGASGALLWYDQATRHDVRDYDFQASPILATLGERRVVFGAGKAGRVVAWDRVTHARMWTRAVGTHLHDLGPLTARPEL